MSTESIEQLEEAAALHNRATAIITSEAVTAAERAEAAQSAAEVAQELAVNASSTVSGATQTVLTAKDEVVALHAEVMSTDYADRLDRAELLISGKQDKLIAGENIRIAPDGVTISATGGGGGGGGSVYDITTVADNTIVLDPKVGYYSKTLTESAYTFKIDASGLELTDKIAKINLVLTIGDVVPTLTFPSNVTLVGTTPSLVKNSQVVIELISLDSSSSWYAQYALMSAIGAYRVDYLLSDGTQYINTEIVADSNLSCEIKMSRNTTAQGDNFMGALANASSRYHFQVSDGVGLWYGTKNQSKVIACDIKAEHIVKIDAINKTYSISEDSIGDSSVELDNSGFNTGVPFYLFARNSTTIVYGVYAIHYAKFWSGETLVGDFVPMIDEDGKPCFYDSVTDKNFYATGTNSLIPPSERI